MKKINIKELEKIAEKHKSCGLCCDKRFTENSNGKCLDNVLEEIKRIKGLCGICDNETDNIVKTKTGSYLLICKNCLKDIKNNNVLGINE